MQDLDNIARANARATISQLATLRGEGYHCVIEYQGLNAVDIHSFKTEGEARAKQGEITDQPGATSAYYPPLSAADPLEHAEQQDAALARQAQQAQKPTIEAVDAPADPGELTVQHVQVAALVLVIGNEVLPQPPQRTVAVVDKATGAIHALCGPADQIESSRDGHVFAQAFALREALRKIIDAQTADIERHAISDAKAVLDAATPVFARVQMPSAEQQLAEARKDYDPSQNPSTASILDGDTLPAETDPWN